MNNATLNNHVSGYLDNYLSKINPPKFAVFLRGEWGTGKTFFIKKYLDEHPNVESIYISLNGVASFAEVEEMFFQQLHPVLSSKGMKIAGKIAQGLLKTAVSIDLSKGDNTLSLSPFNPELKIPDFLKNVEKKALIFDDLERCSIPIASIMGYITQFIEDQGLKVIIIGNENQIIKDDVESKIILSKRFITIKEKVIGHSFDIEPDYRDAFMSFVFEIDDLRCKKIVSDNANFIYDIFNTAGYKSLRHLRLTLFDFERFVKKMPQTKDIKYEGELIEHIIKLFFSISFELKKGNIVESEIKEIMSVDKLLTGKDSATDNITKIINKYSILDGRGHPVSSADLIQFFSYGIMDTERVEHSIKQSFYYFNANTPIWQRLMNFRNIDDVEFDSLIKKLLKNLEDPNNFNKYEIVQSIGVLVYFSNERLIKETKSEVVILGKKALQKLIDKELFKIEKNEDFPSDHSHFLGYFSLKIEEFQDFLKYCNTLVKIELDKHAQSVTIGLIELMISDFNTFDDLISSTNVKDSFIDTPIFTSVSPQEFVDAIMQLSNFNKSKIAGTFEARYSIHEFAKKLIPEKDFLNEVVELLKKETMDSNYSVSKYIIKNQIIPSLEDKCIGWLQESEKIR